MNPSLQEYQVRAHETSGPYEEAVAGLEKLTPQERAEIASLNYTTMGLAGEAGELLNKVKKILRDGGGKITDADRVRLSKEIGGILWYLAETCTVLGLNLGSVAELNIEQLRSRKERNVLHGSGDDR